MHDQRKNTELVAASVVFPDGTAQPGKLERLDLVKVRRRFTDSLNAVRGIEWLVAGLDISLNDQTAQHRGLRWQVQLYGTAEVKDRELVSKGLRKRYVSSRQVKRAIQIKSSDGSNEVISYSLKTEFVRRISYRGEAGPEANGGNAGRPERCRCARGSMSSCSCGSTRPVLLVGSFCAERA